MHIRQSVIEFRLYQGLFGNLPYSWGDNRGKCFLGLLLLRDLTGATLLLSASILKIC